jgi:hypothetical protein
MRRSLAVPLYVAMVFLSGVLVGSVGYRLYNAKTVAAVQTQAQKPKPEEWRRHYVEEMHRRLNLTDDQVVKLQGILDSTKQRFNEYDQHVKAERKSIIEQQHTEIRALLTDDRQHAEYEKFLQERQKHRQESQKNHPPNP